MATRTIPLKDLVLDPEQPADLAALPAGEALAQLRPAYDFLGAETTVSLADGVVTVSVSDTPAGPTREALSWFDEALRLAQRAEYKKAVRLFERVLERLPLHVPARRNLGMAQMELGRSAPAKTLLVQTLRLDPRDADAWIILGNLYKQAADNLAMADACYRRALLVNPDDPILLTNYGALMVDLGNLEQAEEFFERAIAASPDYPNPYYALALIEQRRGQPAAAGQALDRLFALGKPADVRAQPLLVEARKLYAAVNERRALQDHERLMHYVFGRKDELEAETGYPVEIVEDPRLSPEYATLQPAWKYRRDHHLLRYRVKNPTITPHLLLHELRHLVLEAAARRAGRNRVYVMTARNRELAYRSIEGEIARLRQQGLLADTVDRVASDIITGLANQLLNIPFDMAIESDLFTYEAPIRASQFVSLRFTHEDQLQAFTRQDIRRMAPPRVWRANIAMNHAYALFVDSLYGGATDYAAVYRASEAAATDDGVKAAASSSMFSLTGVEGRYDPARGKYQPPQPYDNWKGVVDDRVRTRGLRLWDPLAVWSHA